VFVPPRDVTRARFGWTRQIARRVIRTLIFRPKYGR
jgi:hypothetical protein